MEDNSKKKWFQSKSAKLVSVIVIAFISGYILNSFIHKPSSSSEEIVSGKQAVSQKWTCSMPWQR